MEALSPTGRPDASHGHRLAGLLALACAAAYLVVLSSLDLGRSMTSISSPGSAVWWGLAILVLEAVAMGMLVSDVVVRRERRLAALGLFLAGIGYAVLNVCAFVLTLALDPFTLFEPAYLRSVVLIAPALTMAALVLLALRCRWCGWLGLLGSVAWVGSVGLAHLWVVAQASANV